MQISALAWWQIILLALPALPNLWCIWHASRHDFPSANERYVWVLAGVFIPLLGGLAYLLAGRRRARKLV